MTNVQKPQITSFCIEIKSNFKYNIYLNPHICIQISIKKSLVFWHMHKQKNLQEKPSWVEPRDLKMVPMQMPLGITTIAVKTNTGTVLFK